MKAIAKTQPRSGVEIIDVDEPETRPGHVKIRVERGSVCGTDLHIYNWDRWASERIEVPRIIGHEFCGTIVEVGEGVTDRKVGDFVSSESHIVPSDTRYARLGQSHVDPESSILGVDVDGGFRPFTVIPAANARLTSKDVPKGVAALQDALGNAVHTVMAGPVEDQIILVTGMGPIGLFSVAICKALGAKKVIATEVSEFRINLAEQVGADVILNPLKGDISQELRRLAPDGVDGCLEMSGHPSSFHLAVQHTRPAGRISLLGVYGDRIPSVDVNQIIFKGLEVQGIVGRRLWETWDQMHWLLTEKGLDVSPVITHEVSYTEVASMLETMKRGEAGKVVLSFE